MLKHPGATRNLESTLRSLGERGHTIHLAFESMAGDRKLLDDLCVGNDRFSVDRAPGRGDDQWYALSDRVRRSIDYLRYLEPRYANAPKLRERAAGSAPRVVRRVFELPGCRHPRVVAASGAALRQVELALPTAPHVDDYIRGQSPDAVVVSPLVGIASRQANYVRSARKLGIPCGLIVYSWDNLTNKGLMRDAPDLVMVWNQDQAREAVDLHHVPREQIVVTGAAPYDHWFDWAPRLTHEELCTKAGLHVDRPFLLYVCSSRFVGPRECDFVADWLRALRSSPLETVRDLGVLIRPHPQNAGQWRKWHSPEENVAVWPPAGADPVDEDAKAHYYDSIHHSAAVVGINTSAMVEAAIVGRPIMTVLDPDFQDTQEGTLHFRYLLPRAGGPVQAAASLDEHFDQIAAARDSDSGHAERQVRFLKTFIRPHGLDRAATPLVVDAIEGITRASERRAAIRFVRTAIVRRAFLPVARWSHERQAQHRRRMKAKQKRALEKQERLEHARKAKEARRRAPKTERKAKIRGSLRVDHGRLTEESTNARLGTDGSDPDHVEEARQLVSRLAASHRPIIAGPWLSEVGYELLYWIPFLTWAVASHPNLSDRLTVVSRGGTSHWYSALGVRYAELYETHDPVELWSRSESESERLARGQRKQWLPTPLDDELLSVVGRRIGVNGYEVLHPSAMYRAYKQLVKRNLLVTAPRPIFRYRPMTRPPLGPLSSVVPSDYVAVRFYFSKAFPETTQNVAFLRELIEALTRKVDVVVLNPAMRFDDHWDFEVAASDRMHSIDHFMTPTNNLDVQTAAIAGARSFIGTYGGLSYLAPLLGVQSIAIHDDVPVKTHHLELAERIYSAPYFGSFRAICAKDIDLGGLPDGAALWGGASAPTVGA